MTRTNQLCLRIKIILKVKMIPRWRRILELLVSLSRQRNEWSKNSKLQLRRVGKRKERKIWKLKKL